MNVLISIAFPLLILFQISAADIRARLQTDDIQTRAEAFEGLLATPNAFKDPATVKVLVEVLDKENHLIESTLRDSNEQVGVSRKYGDAYGDYIDDLRDTVADKADLHDPQVLRVLMMSSFAPESPFGRNMAKLGEALLPVLVERAASDLEIERSVAYEMLGIIVDVNRGHLSTRAAASIRKTILDGTKDKGLRARFMSVHALGFIGTNDDIPLLQKITESDTEEVVQKEAARSIQRIKDRG